MRSPLDRVAVIDLGPAPSVRDRITAALVGAKLEVVTGHGLDEALSGITADRDAALLTSAMAEVTAQFGALDCQKTIASAWTVIGVSSARQAAGLPAPELPNAWAYMLLCADRTADVTLAVQAASQLRALGGSPHVDAAMLARYPSVDVVAGSELVELEIKSEPGADVWIDGARAGTAPVHAYLPSGRHVIAAASGSKRGFLTGTVVKTQPVVEVPLVEQKLPAAALGKRIASWNGEVPAADELRAVFDELHVRMAVIRHRDTLEVWGRAGRADPPHLLGGEDGKGTLDELDRIAALVADRITGWNDHAPDPDQPLLVETPAERGRSKRKDEPTPWWVYATIAGALATGVIIIYANESIERTQRVELHYP